MDIDVREMRQVATIASEGSFAKAARALHISQPALSRSIKEVERKCGFKLFERGREGALLTDTGRAFVLQAAEILALASNMERELALIRGLDVGEIFIGAGVYASEMFVSEAMATFARPDTRTRIRIINDQPDLLMQRLRRREVDIAIADPAWIEPSTEIKQNTMNFHRGFLVARRGHPLFARRGVTVKHVLNYPFATMALVPNRIALMGKNLPGHVPEEQRLLEKWPPAITVNSITSMKTIAAASDAIILVSLKMIQHELERKELGVLPFDLPWLGTRFAVMQLAHRTLSPLARAITESLVAEDKKLLIREQQLTGRWFRRSRRDAERKPA
jgi:DNA-binding transcriptional LysR family regulator